jgi:uncharacterized membrane protein YgcG
VVVTAMMAVFVVAGFAVTRRGSVVIVMSGTVVIMVVNMHAQSRYIFACMPMQTHRRRPGKLERQDEHEDQGNEATHGGHSSFTGFDMSGS